MEIATTQHVSAPSSPPVLRRLTILITLRRPSRSGCRESYNSFEAWHLSSFIKHTSSCHGLDRYIRAEQTRHGCNHFARSIIRSYTSSPPFLPHPAPCQSGGRVFYPLVIMAHALTLKICSTGMHTHTVSLSFLSPSPCTPTSTFVYSAMPRVPAVRDFSHVVISRTRYLSCPIAFGSCLDTVMAWHISTGYSVLSSHPAFLPLRASRKRCRTAKTSHVMFSKTF